MEHYYYYPHFLEDETRAQRFHYLSEMRSWQLVELASEPESRTHALNSRLYCLLTCIWELHICSQVAEDTGMKQVQNERKGRGFGNTNTPRMSRNRERGGHRRLRRSSSKYEKTQQVSRKPSQSASRKKGLQGKQVGRRWPVILLWVALVARVESELLE